MIDQPLYSSRDSSRYTVETRFRKKVAGTCRRFSTEALEAGIDWQALPAVVLNYLRASAEPVHLIHTERTIISEEGGAVRGREEERDRTHGRAEGIVTLGDEFEKDNFSGRFAIRRIDLGRKTNAAKHRGRIPFQTNFSESRQPLLPSAPTVHGFPGAACASSLTFPCYFNCRPLHLSSKCQSDPGSL